MSEKDTQEFLSAISGLIDPDIFNKYVNQIISEELNNSDESISSIIPVLPNIEMDLDDIDIKDLSNLKDFYYIQSNEDVLTAYELLIEDLYRENKGLKIKQEKTDEIMNKLQTLFPDDDDEFERIWDGETLHDALTKIYEIVFDG